MNDIIAFVKEDSIDIFKKKRVLLLFIASMGWSVYILRTVPKEVIDLLMNIGKNQTMVDILIIVTILLLNFSVMFFFPSIISKEERTSKNYEILLTAPIGVGKIITAKAFTTFVFSYIITFIAIIGVMISLYLNMSMFLIPSFYTFFSVFIFIPIFSFSYVRLYGAMLFSSRNTQNLMGLRLLFMMGGIIATTNLVPIILKHVSPQNFIVCVDTVILLLSIIIFFVTNIVIKKLPKEKIIKIVNR